MIRDIRMILTRLFTVALLMMISMAAGAQVKVIYGKDGEAMKADEKGTIVIPQKEQKEPLVGGTITITQEKPTDGKVRVNFTVAPASGYTYNDGNITLVAFIPLSSTRADSPAEDITVHSTLTLRPKDESQTDTSKPRDYYVDIDEGLGLWVQSATFTKENEDTSKGNRTVSNDGYSGTYYIASHGYDFNPNNTNNFYLCPTKGWCSYKATDDYEAGDNQPFLTTYKCKTNGYSDGVDNAVWIIEKAPNSDYYYIIHKKDNKYMVSNGQINTASNPDRMRVHLEAVADDDVLAALGDKALFSINPYASSNKTYMVIRPMSITEETDGSEKNHDGYDHTTHRWLTVNGGNDNTLKGASGKGGGPGNTNDQYKYTKGIVCIFNEGDSNADFYLEDVITRPTITIDSDKKVVITAAQSGDVTIKYTTDGSTPSASNGTEYTVAFELGDYVTIKAVAIVSSEVSNVATFQRRLIQNQNNGWNENTDFYFYMTQGDDDNSITKVNTTSLFRPSMEWYLIDAKYGLNYIVNASNNMYLCYDGTNVSLTDYISANDNNYKFGFRESPTAGTFNICPYLKNILYKNGGNDNAAVLSTWTYSDPHFESENARWKFVLPSELDKTAPFTVSNSSTGSYTYYQLRSSGDAFYINAPASADANATMISEVSADENSYWYLEEAAAATTDDWLTYYFIRNAMTGDYLYYSGPETSDNNAAFKTSANIGEEARYQFAWAHSTTTDCYFIVPKMLRDKTLNNFSTMNRYNNTLRVQKVRATGTSAWSFSAVPDFHCDKPVITWSASYNGYVITAKASDVKIYYKTDEGELTPSTGTLYTTGVVIPVADLGVESATIRAIAVRSADGSDASTEASVTVSRVATPSISQTEDGKIELTCDTEGASIYYNIGIPGEVSEPTTTGSTLYSNPIEKEDAEGKVIKAIAVKDGMINSDVMTSETIVFVCATPLIVKTSDNKFKITCSFPSGATIRYTKGDGTQAAPTESTGEEYGGPVPFNESELPFTIKAIAYATGFVSSNATKELTWNLTPDDDIYVITNADEFNTFVDMVNGDWTDKTYKITADINVSSPDEILVPFTGVLMGEAKADGSLPVISGMDHAIFKSINGGTVKNIILDNVNISGSGNRGAIANEAKGDTRIYNCGVLATGSQVETDENGYTHITSCSSTIRGNSGYVGGIVGLLDGTARVINCFSYANITGGNKVGGIVGYNNVATTSVASNQKTMVMNCMFYGDITGGSSKAPIYNGKIITNLSGSKGVSNFNYFWAGASYVQDQDIDEYNCALSAETRYLQRFEFFRHLLNSNRALAAWWATGSRDNKNEMMKWVMEPSQIGTSTPYPILKSFAKYPSVVNIDVNHSEEGSVIVGPKVDETLRVTINQGSNAPNGAGITTPSLSLEIQDKDPAHFNFNYYKVQLPYYNDVGTGNYTGNKVVTGWEVTVSGATGFTDDSDDATATVTDGVIELTTPYNFADRNSTGKDDYSTNGNRIFNQGAYFDVPKNVSSITIKPHWANCVFVADEYMDVVYNQGMDTPANVTTVGGGKRYENGKIKIDGTDYEVKTTMSAAVSALNSSGHVYDNAIVLVGNVHYLVNATNKATDHSTPYTIMSIDLDKDNEPDYSYIFRLDGRVRVHPVRVDFLNVIGLGMAQKSDGGTGTYNIGIMQPKYWFEVTNTGLFRVTQLEYDRVGRENNPMILHGGVIEQWVTIGETEAEATEANAVSYYHVGGNVWFKEFHIGAHQDKNKLTNKDDFYSPHPPISVSGGDYEQFYLTGYYNTPNNNADDNAECYINGGRFGKVAGTGMQGIGAIGGNSKGDIIWQIDNADIDEFYAGGINAAHIAEGDIYTVISNSRVDQFCGGPKFGNMNSDKKVVTNADKCIFRTFFGAGYGGNSYNRRYPNNQNGVTNINWNSWVSEQLLYKYTSGSGVETRIDYQFIPMSANTSNVARLFVDQVSFSLATTHDVTSKLTNCTITTRKLGRLNLFDQCIGNFYGGGSLGKVAGPVTSTLTNCTVEGNVYGAGYSATLPTVDVMRQSFQKEPHYDSSLGAYLEAELPATTTYRWEHKDVVSSTSNAINTTDRVLFTTEDLSQSNLGSVSGAVTLTITTTGSETSTIGTAGNTNTGNVYGGGDESYVYNESTPANAYTVVNLSGNTTVHGSVFGGGNKGEVSGSATVNIQQ